MRTTGPPTDPFEPVSRQTVPSLAMPNVARTHRARLMRAAARRSRRRGRPGAQSVWDYNQIGVHLYAQQAYDLAIAAFQRAVGAAAIPLAVLDINLGAACLRGKLYSEARGWLKQGLALAPDDQRGHWLLAQVLKAEGELFEARAEFERAYALDPDSCEGRSAEDEIVRWRLPWPPGPGPSSGA